MWTKDHICVIICVVALINSKYILQGISAMCAWVCFARPDLLPGLVHISGHTVTKLFIAWAACGETCCNHYLMTLEYKVALLAVKKDFHSTFDPSSIIRK